MLENIGMGCFRAVPCEKMCGSKYHGPGVLVHLVHWKTFFAWNSTKTVHPYVFEHAESVSRDFDPFSKYSVVNSYSNPLKGPVLKPASQNCAYVKFCKSTSNHPRSMPL